MTQGKTVSQAYLLGINEGRSLYRQLQLDGMATLDTFREVLATSEALLRQGFAYDMRQMILGERDFWRDKVKRLEQGSIQP